MILSSVRDSLITSEDILEGMLKNLSEYEGLPATAHARSSHIHSDSKIDSTGICELEYSYSSSSSSSDRNKNPAAVIRN